MPSLLPILTPLPLGNKALGEAGPSRDFSGKNIQEHSPLPDKTFAQTFSQLVQGQEESNSVLKEFQALLPTPTQQNDGARQLETLLSPEVVSNILSDGPITTVQKPLDELAQPIPVKESFRHLSPQIFVEGDSLPALHQNESHSQRTQNVLPETLSVSASLNGAIIPLTDREGVQVLSNSKGHVLPPSRMAHIPGMVTSDHPRDLSYVRQTLAPLPKVLEAGLVAPQTVVSKVSESGMVVPQAVVSKVPGAGPVSPQAAQASPAQLHLTEENPGEEETKLRPVLQPVKEKPNGQEQVSRLAQDQESVRIPPLPRFLNQATRSPLVLSATAPVTALKADGPVGFTEHNVANQTFLKPIAGSAVLSLNVPSMQTVESQLLVPADMPGDTGLIAKGERLHNMVETSIKAMSVEPSGGQGLGTGMNQFSQSQSGSQQQTFLPGQGAAVRGLEEPRIEFPTSPLQRLQLDVQLSDNQRVQIDLGVQNRQVYAGLLMDQSVLRNLATQFVPQLENQLNEVDLELQEFSAEVREEHDANAFLRESRFQQSEHKTGDAQNKTDSPQNSLMHTEDRGLHLVA